MKIKQFRVKLSENKVERVGGERHSYLDLPDLDYDEKRINEFMADKKIVSVNTDVFTTQHHNNAGYDQNYALITILYED